VLRGLDLEEAMLAREQRDLTEEGTEQ